MHLRSHVTYGVSTRGHTVTAQMAVRGRRCQHVVAGRRRRRTSPGHACRTLFGRRKFRVIGIPRDHVLV